MLNLLFSPEIRETERQCSFFSQLMQRAGEAAAHHAETMLPTHGGAHIIVLAGGGNNGGDAWVAARTLQKRFYRVTVLTINTKPSAEPAAAQASKEFIASGGRVVDAWPKNESCDLIIDGLLGIGLTRNVDGEMAQLIRLTNKIRVNDRIPLLSLDVPSGLNADTGALMGEAMMADETLTFIAAKPGLYTADGVDCAGKVTLETLGVETSSENHLLALAEIQSQMMTRKRNSHKGNFGALGIIGGAAGMVGAAVLTARAAINFGAGKVYLATLATDALSFDPQQPEIMLRRSDALLKLDELTALAVGPGMGTGDTAAWLIENAIDTALPLVLDADALNLLASNAALANKLIMRAKNMQTILTPHPGEAARLLNISTAEVQQNRITATLKIAAKFHCHVVLKGAGSICASPEGHYVINPTGNPGMASAGMGDVLTGLIGALLAQGFNAESAIKVGVYLHGLAADQCVANHIGPIGLTASDVIRQARLALNALNV